MDKWYPLLAFIGFIFALAWVAGGLYWLCYESYKASERLKAGEMDEEQLTRLWATRPYECEV